MSDANTIDSLKISVESTADGAGSSLDKLAENLSHLASSLKDMDLGKVASGFETLAQGITNVATATQGIDASALKEVADAYDKIAGKANNAPTFNTPKIKQTTPEAVPKIANIVDVEPEIESVNRLDNALSSLKDRFKSAFSDEGRESAKNEEIQALIAKVKEYKQTISDMNSGKTPFNLSDYNAAKEGFSQATAKLASLKGEAESASGSLSEFIALLKKAGVTALAMKGISAPFKLFGKLIHHGIDGLKEFGEKAKTAGTKFSDFGKKVGQRFAFTLLRKAINAVIESLKAGVDALAKFDGAISNTFDKNLGSHISGLKAFGYQLVAAFAPIYNAIAPAVTYLIGLLNTLAQAIAQVFSGLTGGSTWVKAVASSANYSKSLEKNTGGAAKNAKKMKNDLTLGIDELNILKDNDTGGSGGGGGGGLEPLEPKFEESNIDPEIQKLIDKIKKAWEKADFTELGTIFGKKVKNALQSVPWDFIKEIAEKVGKSFATFLNGVLETEGLGEEVGKAIGEIINTYVELIDSFFANLHFDSLGKFIGDVLNGLTDTIEWEKIGEGWATKLNGLFDMLRGIALEWDAAETGKQMATTLATAIEEINWEENGASLALFANDLFQCLDNFILDVPWDELGKGIADSINGFFETFNWSQAGKSLADFVNGMFDFVSNLVNETDWEEVGRSITEAITSFFGNIDWSSVGSTISGFVSGLLDFLSGSFDAVDWQKLPQDIIDAMVDFFSGLDGSDIADSVFKLLGSAFGAVAGFLKGTWDAIVKIGQAIKDAFVEWFTDNAFNEEGEFVIEGLLNGILDALADIGTWIYDHIFKPFVDGFKSAFGIASPSKVMEEQGGFLMDGLSAGISAGIDGVVGFFTDLKDKVVTAVTDLADGAKQKFSDLKEGITTKASEIYEGAKEKFDNLKEKIGTAVSDASTKVKDKFNEIHDKINEKSGGALTIVEDKFKNIKEKISEGAKTAYENVKEKFSSIKEQITTAATDSDSTVLEKFTSIASIIATNAGEACTAVGTKFGEMVTTAGTKLGEIVTDAGTKANDIVKKFTGIDLSKAAKDAIGGFLTGMKEKWEGVTKWIQGAAEGVSKKFKEVLKIHSPSRVMAEIGVDTIAGFNEGMEEESVNTEDTIESVSGIITNKFSTSIADYLKAIGLDAMASFNDGLVDGTGDTATEVNEPLNSIAEAFRETFGGVQTIVKDILADTVEEVRKFAQQAVEVLQSFSNTDMGGMSKGTKKTEDATNKANQQMISMANNSTETIFNAVANMFRRITTNMFGTLESVQRTLSEELRKIIQICDSAFTEISNRWKRMLESMRSILYYWQESVSSAMSATMNNVANSINNAMANVEANANARIASLRAQLQSLQAALAGASSASASKAVSSPSPIYAINKRAMGGFTPKGDLFLANENENEFIGHIGSNPAVANNDQIINGITYGVRSAVTEVLVPYLADISVNTRETADKDMVVALSDRDIALASQRGQRSLGWTLRTT